MCQAATDNLSHRDAARKRARPSVTGFQSFFQTAGKFACQVVQKILIAVGVHAHVHAQVVQFGQAHRQAFAEGVGQPRSKRRLAEDAGRTGGLQLGAHGGNMACSRLDLRRYREHAGMAQSVGFLEIVEGFMEDEERLAGKLAQAFAEFAVEPAEALLEGLQVGPVAPGVGRVDLGQVFGHPRGDGAGVGRQQPEVGVEHAGTMVMVVLVVPGMLLFLEIDELAQVHARQVLHRDAGALAAGEHLGQEVFQVRADPVEQLHLAQPPYVGRTQGVLVRRGARRQQYVRLADAVLDGRGDQLQRFDAGQHADLGARRRSQQEQGEAGGQQGKGTQGHGGTHMKGG